MNEVYFLIKGWVSSTIDVDFDHRQLVKIHLPGEMLGLPNMALVRSAETLTALTPATIGVIPLGRLAQLFETAPRLAFTLFVAAQQERVMLMDHVAALGQTKAIQRVCAMLLRVHRRVKMFDVDRGDVIEWPLSQRHFGQGAGITTIHVNRTLRELQRRRLIARAGKRIRLLDIEQLTKLAALPERHFVREPEWLTGVQQRVPDAPSTGEPEPTR